MTTLIAQTRIKWQGRVVLPGATFETDPETAKRYLAEDVAITPTEARAAQRKGMTAEEKLREAEEETP